MQEGPAKTSPGSKLGLLVGLLVLLIPLGVYILLLCPTVFVGDAGDFLTAAFTLGVPHPPGYPTYTVLGNLFMNLPIPGGISAPAYRMNMMSAVAAWGACVFLFLFLRRILKTEWTALAGALILAFSRQFWQHAEIAEVYTLQMLFLSLILYLSVLYVQEKKIGWAYALAFFMGFAMTHQYAILLFYPGILIFIGMNGMLRLKLSSWAIAVVLAIIGLLPYAYLPIVRYKTPLGPIVFVESREEGSKLPMDVVPITESPYSYFWDYFARRGYSKARVYTHNVEAMPERTTTPMVLRKTMQTAKEDFEIPLLLFGGLGWLALIFSLFRKRARDGDKSMIPAAAMLPAALGYILYFLIVHFYPSGDILAAPLENLDVVVPPLLIPLEFAMAMIIAFGIDRSIGWLVGYVGAQGEPDPVNSQKFKVFASLLLISVFALIGVNFRNSVEVCDKSNAVISYNYAKNVLDSCDENSILITTGDETFLFWYMQACEPSPDPDDPYPGYRKDVRATNWVHNLPGLEILDQGEQMAMAIVTERFIASSTYYTDFLETYDVPMIKPDFGFHPINTTFIADAFSESSVIMYLDCVMQGLVYSFRAPGDIPDVSLPEVTMQADLGAIREGAAPMLVIDYFDSRSFENYSFEGLPRFVDIEPDLSNLATSQYLSVDLEAQEREVLARYQDAFYRFGIQDLLSESDESGERAVSYLFQCVSLDPTGWFGWKELGDAFFSIGRLESAEEAYKTILDPILMRDDLEPGLLAGAHAQIGHIALIRSSNPNLSDDEAMALLELAESEARRALALNPDDGIGQAILGEIQRQMSLDDDGSDEEESQEVVESDSSEGLDDSEGLEGFTE